jgi:hypothetical protein
MPRVEGKLPDRTHPRSILSAEIDRLTEAFAAASERAWRETVAGNHASREAAENQRQEAAGDLFLVKQDFADLLLLLLRYAIEQRPCELAAYLAEALQNELRPLVDAIANLEGKR